MTDPCLSLLRDLVAIDSVNPSLVAGAAGEGAIGEAIAAAMHRIGLDVTIQEILPGRRNVVGVLEGQEPGESLMFCGHMDTVGVEGMAAPFDPVERNGRVYGRGAQDMKGGLAAMIDAARVARARGFRRGRLIVAAVIDEEHASVGADALVRNWQADAAVVTEPTGLDVGVAHKGFAWMEVETRGRAAHGSRPAEGRDAILRMGRVLNALDAFDRELQARPPHPLLGTASLHASFIDGGREWSTYPDRCRLRVERRTIEGETGEGCVEEVGRLIDGLQREDPDFEASAALLVARPPYALPAAHPLPPRLIRVAEQAGAAPSLVGMSFWTDAAILGHAGIPCAIFGPGGAGLHSLEEYVHIADVLRCRDALASLALDGTHG